MRDRFFVVLVIAACLALGACGSDGGPDVASDESTTSTSAEDTSSTETTDATGTDDSTTTSVDPTDTTSDGVEVEVEADQQAAERAVAVFEDAVQAAGFTTDEEPGQTDEGSDGSGADSMDFTSEACQVFEDAFSEDDLPGQTAQAESREFESAGLTTGLGEAALLSVGVVEDPSTLEEVFALYRDERLPACLEESITGGSSAPAPEAEVTVTERSGLGDDAVEISLTQTVGAGDDAFPYTSAITFVRVGRSATILVGITGGEGEPTWDRNEVLDAVLAELTDFS